MLGEAALTARTRDATSIAYLKALHAIGRAADGRGVIDGPGHLGEAVGAASALFARAARPRDAASCCRASRRWRSSPADYDIGLNIDAEEADRLELSLDLIEALARDPALAAWDGLGVVVQAYQKRAPFVHRLGRRRSRASAADASRCGW